MEDLVIKLKLNRDEARREQRAFVAEQKRVEAEVLTDVHAKERAKVALVKEANRERVRDARDAMKEEVEAQKRAAIEAAATWKDKATDISKSSIAMIGGATAVAQHAMSMIKQVLTEVGQALRDAEARSRRLAGGFGEQREAVAHLAGLEGRKPDNEYVLDLARRNARTGLTPQEALAAGESFFNSAAQFKGRTISNAEFDQFREQQERLAVSRSVEADVLADMSGRQLGTTDFRRFGANASEMALAGVNQKIAILEAGGGNVSQLGRETVKLEAATANEEALRGQLRPGVDAAKIISIMAEGMSEGQAVAAASGMRALRGVGEKDKQAPLLNEAGVTLEDSVFSALEKLTPVLEARARAGKPGTSIQDVLTQNIPDVEAARAISIMINKGVSGGAFAARDVVATQNAGPESVMNLMNAADLFPNVRERRAAQNEILAELEVGGKGTELEVERRNARAQLIRGGLIDTPTTNLTDKIVDTLSAGLFSDREQRRVNAQTEANLREREAAAGLPPPDRGLGRRLVGMAAHVWGGSFPGIGPQMSAAAADTAENLLGDRQAETAARLQRLNVPGAAPGVVPVPGPQAGAAPVPGGNDRNIVAALNRIEKKLPGRPVNGPPVRASNPRVDTRGN